VIARAITDPTITLIFDFMGHLLLRDPVPFTIASRSSCDCEGFHREVDFRHPSGFRQSPQAPPPAASLLPAARLITGRLFLGPPPFPAQPFLFMGPKPH
jgi:hypothetical protein